LNVAAVTLGELAYGRSRLRMLVAVVAGTSLIALSAQISIPLGFTPVPLTGQTFAVLLVGAALGTLGGAASTALYVLIGALGAPVYASHDSGWHILTSATGGYLFGFIAAAALTGALAQHGWDRRFSSSLGALLTGNVVIYIFGIAMLARSLHLDLDTALKDGLYPFLLGDLIKLYLAAASLPIAWRLLERDR
jgi:biotin transport system substrate-specific component